ncbi:ATP-dependent DNA helicase PIF2-like [Helianthus annuus]|uniref:ATP-dependent DNA helicase PIF2-like n=1 Tax=Helianthus annuus TaxID=4232 RepID=UPI000B90542C|nr:ATP-dependent DNA helicase PIF2-like [Helianthus annuus]
MKELSYDKLALQREHDGYVKYLTAEQERIYKIVMEAILKGDGSVFSVYGYGGTGKTFLWKTFSTSLRSKGEVVSNVASCGIASLLLDGGRTAHSRFVIPINIIENSVCSIEPNTELGDLIKRATLIIWDEAPMTHKHCFEALDRTMRDISCSSQPNMQSKPFGGKVILFGGDFRQILPVIPKGTITMIVNAYLNSSYIWRHYQVLKLTEIMGLRVGCHEADLKEIKEVGERILKLGDGLLGEGNDGEIDIEIPDDLLIHDQVNPISSLISFIYPGMNKFLWDLTYFQQRAILGPTNEVVDSINKELLESLPGKEKVYFSLDSLCQSEEESELNMALFPPDVLNNLRYLVYLTIN